MPKLNPNIELQPLDDKLILLDLEQNAYYSLNGTARFFVEKIAKNLEFEQIIDEALQEYEIDKDCLTQDFTKLRDELIQLRIITP
ncbi:MAG: PqqD family protein [Proteobacteria bacterium]|nr:PqqD family protein [Pseudomonadota bacterium]